MVSSGTYGFNPSNADLSLDVLNRIGIRGPAISATHMQELRTSAGLILADWSANRSVNLWTVDLQSIPLVQGVVTYFPPANTIALLDVYLRTFQLGAPINFAPAFTTVLGSPTVTVTLAASGVTVGQWLAIVVPVSVGGLILLGYYQVVSTPDGNNFTITAAGPATASVVAGGLVPIFTTVAASTQVSVALAAHGYLAGQTFMVQVPITLGGITLSGPYPISSITNANNFLITSPVTASSNQTLAENGTKAQIKTQSNSANPTDRILGPISRDDYAAQPNKFSQAPPTTYWFNRQINPQVTLWEAPDASGPYELFYYRMREIQDWDPLISQTTDAPTRFLRAFTAELAWDLAIKFPEKLNAKAGITVDTLKGYAAMHWATAAGQDTEFAPVRLQPNFSPYWR